jgi:hypothetical protein
MMIVIKKRHVQVSWILGDESSKGHVYPPVGLAERLTLSISRGNKMVVSRVGMY